MQNVEPKHTFVVSIFKIGPVAGSGQRDDINVHLFSKSPFLVFGGSQNGYFQQILKINNNLCSHYSIPINVYKRKYIVGNIISFNLIVNSFVTKLKKFLISYLYTRYSRNNQSTGWKDTFFDLFWIFILCHKLCLCNFFLFS